MNDNGLSERQRQDPVFRTRPYTGTTANALGQVDLGMLQAGTMTAAPLRFRTRREALFVAMELRAPAQQRCDREKQETERNGEGEPVHEDEVVSTTVP